MRALLLLALAGAASAEAIRADTKLPPGERRLEEPIRILADGITLDLGEAVLVGRSGDPDGFEGTAILVEGRRRVTVRGGAAKGWKCAILVRDCEEVTLEGIDVSGNFAARLRSTPEREDESDWLWPHRNDGGEWRTNYGAGICLENSRRCVVRGCVGRKQQNGLILDRASECRVLRCDFSFNSGWGIALWRSSRNVLEGNRCDFCVRGFSHGVYERGQDSAGFLVFEQCRRNEFRGNSATHSGDGFFLYAGHETVERTGEGGCDENLVVGNDFSHAVANGIEATFSSGNRFEGNRCIGCNYGIWAGYSVGTVLSGNVATGSIAGIAIEHGSETAIRGNSIAGPVGIRLWWDPDEELAKLPYAKRRHLRSEGYAIEDNAFDAGTAIRLEGTSRVGGGKNRGAYREFLRADAACAEISLAPGEPGPAPGVPPSRRAEIRVGEWGPLDPGEPAVFPSRVVDWGACRFHVLGPEAEYEVEGVSAERGERSFSVRGGPGLTPFRGKVRIGRRVFPFEGAVLNAIWRVRFWSWERDPRENAGSWASLLATAPLEERTLDRLSFRWKDEAPSPLVPRDRFATVAETTLRLPKGRYRFRTVSDDGVRLLVDGKTVLENWTWHGATEDSAVVDLEAGEHALRVEHFEIDGWAALGCSVEPVAPK